MFKKTQCAVITGAATWNLWSILVRSRTTLFRRATKQNKTLCVNTDSSVQTIVRTEWCVIPAEMRWTSRDRSWLLCFLPCTVHPHRNNPKPKNVQLCQENSNAQQCSVEWERAYVVVERSIDGTIIGRTRWSKTPLLTNVQIDVTPKPVFHAASLRYVRLLVLWK